MRPRLGGLSPQRPQLNSTGMTAHTLRVRPRQSDPRTWTSRVSLHRFSFVPADGSRADGRTHNTIAFSAPLRQEPRLAFRSSGGHCQSYNRAATQNFRTLFECEEHWLTGPIVAPSHPGYTLMPTHSTVPSAQLVCQNPYLPTYRYLARKGLECTLRFGRYWICVFAHFAALSPRILSQCYRCVLCVQIIRSLADIPFGSFINPSSRGLSDTIQYSTLHNDAYYYVHSFTGLPVTTPSQVTKSITHS